MIRFLLLLLLVGCGPEDEMARVSPRVTGAVIQSKNQERISAQRTATEQDSAYQPEAFVRPATLDAAAATGSLTVNTAGDPSSAWVASRLKGVTSKSSFNAVQIVADYVTGSSVTGQFTVALCNYDDSAPEVLTIRESVRGRLIQTVASPGAGGIREVVELDRPVTLFPGGKYALAIQVTASGSGTVSLSASSARAEALSHDGLSASDLFNVDFDGIDQSSPVVQIGGNPVLMTMVNTTDSTAARNIKNWY